MWETIENVAQSPKWKPYFPAYESPYFGESRALKQYLLEHDISVDYQTVSQHYAENAREQFRNYLSGLTPIYAPFQQMLSHQGEAQEKIQQLKNDFLNDIVDALMVLSEENKTFVKRPDGAFQFNYERIVFKGHLNLELEYECTASTSGSSLKP